MYPGYQFGQQPPSFDQNQIMGQLPPMGGIMPPQQGQQMLPMLGQMQSGALQQPPDPTQQGPTQQHGHHGFMGQFGPLFGLAGMLASHGKLGQFAPMLGGLMGFGLSKSGLFK